jgi:hypothetical protein
VVTKAGSKSTTGRRRTPGRSAAIGIADALADISDLKTAQDVGTRVKPSAESSKWSANASAPPRHNIPVAGHGARARLNRRSTARRRY